MKGLVPTESLPKLIKKLEKLQKRAEKLGVPPLEFSISNNVYLPDPERGDFGLRIEVVEVYIEGEPPKLAGWEFVAKIDHKEALILSPSGEEDIPVEFRDLDPGRCDHCRTNRRRVRSFIVRSEESGEYKQVGSTCVADFLGHSSVNALLAYANQMAMLGAFFGQMCDLGGRTANWVDIVAVLAVTSRVIAEKGWVSRSAARDDERLTPTSDTVEQVVFGEGWGEYQPQEQDWQNADGAVAWILELDSGKVNEYLFNCQTIARSGAVTLRRMGYAASLLPAFMRETGRWERQKHNGGFVGEPGEALVAIVKVDYIRSFENSWGRMSHLHKLVTPEGSLLVWWAPKRTGLSVGDTIRIACKVKKHEEFRSELQTVVNYLKVSEA